MKATGIVRRIDELGRIVIPKEIRRTLRIRETDPMEIFTDSDGTIVLKKYSPIGEIGLFAKQYAEALASVAGHLVIITDREQVIAATGIGKNEYIGKRVTKALENIMDERQVVNSTARNNAIVYAEGVNVCDCEQVIYPIICEGDVIGTVIIMSKDNNKFSDAEHKLAGVAAVFLGKQMEN